MPLNNLSEHLKWLLSEKPFVPPTISLVSYDPEAPTSSETLSQYSSNLIESTPNNETAPSTARPITRPLPARLEAQSIDIHEQLSAVGTVTDMARLRATPGSGKPRLVLAGVPSRTTPSGVSRKTIFRDLHTTGTDCRDF